MAFDEIMMTKPKLAYAVMFQVLSNMRRNESNALNQLMTKAEELERTNKKLTIAQEELVKAERFKREIEIAGEVQRSLLPNELAPDIPDREQAPLLHFGICTIKIPFLFSRTGNQV